MQKREIQLEPTTNNYDVCKARSTKQTLRNASMLSEVKSRLSGGCVRKPSN